jgi:energy-coupling factor transport system permease protein
MRSSSRRRALHPAAWWLWAGLLAAAASRTTNPILLALVASVVGFVVAARRTSAEWSRSLAVFVRLGLVVIVIRVALQVVFGNRLPGHVIVTLPQVPLPSWAQGVSIGGPVTVEAVLGAAVQGMRLAVILVCFGAANSLANPYRLLRCLPAVLYEAGVAVTVSLAFVPEVVITLGALRDARRLRGRPVRGVAGLRGMAVPVLESALERSLQLASSMDSRGYGRRSEVGSRTRRLRGGATAVGLLAVVVGIYGALDPGSLPVGGIPFLLVGAVLVALALALGGRRSVRTRYRPDVWRAAEWAVVTSGAVALAAVVSVGLVDPAALQLVLYPLTVPALPPLATLGVLAAMLPAFAAPKPAVVVVPRSVETAPVAPRPEVDAARGALR